MLQFFRRHRGAFLITLTVIIILSFSVWGGWKKGRDAFANKGDAAFTIYGRDYTVTEMERYERYMQLMSMLQMFDLYQGLMMVAQEPETRGNDLVFNLLVLQHEMDRMGIHPSDAEAKAGLEKLPALQENGQFSPQRANMVESNLGMYGFKSSDMLEIMKLNIGFKKLQDLLGKNYTPSPVETEKAYASRHQTLKISTASFALDDFKKQVQIKDEDIQKYYDENKETYKTTEKRAVSYVHFEEASPEPAKKPEDKKAADAKPDEKKADDKKPEAPKEKTEEEKQKEKQKAQQDLVDRVNKFNEATLDPKAKFEDIAKKLNEKAVAVPAFAKDSPPDAIKTEQEVIDAIFQLNKESRPISDPVKASKGYYIVGLAQVDEPKQQPLAEVKEKIKETLVTQKAQEAMSKAVNEARTAIQEGLKAGKKFDDIAREKKLTVSPQKELDIAQPAPDLENGFQIAREAEHTPAGEVAKAVDTDKGAVLVYVHSKELRKRDDSANLRKSTEDSTARMERMHIFNAWFSQKRKEAKVKLHVQTASA